MSKIDRSCWFAAGAGKTNATLQWITMSSPPILSTDKIQNTSSIVYVATREEVESLDTERFLASFGPHIGKRALQKHLNSIHFTIDGYDQQSEELFESVDVRAYYAHLHKIFPCWLFFGHLSFSTLDAVMLSILPNMRITRTREQIFVETSSEDVHTFFMESLPTAALLHARAGISKQSGANQLAITAKHLGLPDK